MPADWDAIRAELLEMGRGDLALLKDLARDGSLFQGYHPLEVAMLEDRIRTFEGRPQRYGTQFDWDEHGHLSLLPLEDPAGVDARRRAIGLGPLAQDLWQTPRRTSALDGPPATWRRGVG